MRIKHYQRERALFFRQLATLQHAGVSLHQSYKLIEKNTMNENLRQIIRALKKDLAAGKSLTRSFHKHKTYFGEIAYQLIKISEASGQFEIILEKISDIYEKNILLQERINHALFYPTIVVIIGVIMLFIMTCFVIPQFMLIFADYQDKLPLLTLWIFKGADFLKYAGILISIFFLSAWLLRNNRKLFFAKFVSALMNFPYLRQIPLQMNSARFTRYLAILLSSGLALTQALQLIAQEAKDNIVAQHAHFIYKRINAGFNFHQTLQKIHYYPELMVHMIQIGEITGTLDHACQKIADLYEREFEKQLAQVAQLIEPLIMLLLGVVIGGVVLGLYLPIFKLGMIL